MKYLGLFLFTFVTSYLIYYIVTIRQEKKKEKIKSGKKKKKKNVDDGKIPVEVSYMILKYHIDLKKVSYLRFLHVLALVGSFDISLIVVIVSQITSVVLQLIVGFFLAIPIILISYRIVGTYYKKKGMITNENK